MTTENKSKLKIKPVKEKEKQPTIKVNEPQDDKEYDYIKIPPDGGYGWVVLIACFVSVSNKLFYFHCAFSVVYHTAN